jgi:hypothetical protein
LGGFSKFELIEFENAHATAVKYGKRSFMQLIDCFNWWTEGSVTAVKLTITTREKDSKRVCRLRGLVGNKKEVIDFIALFRNRSGMLAQSKMVSQEDNTL